jgi:hypothetical protein
MIRCPFCKAKIFGEKKVGDKFKCYMCNKKLTKIEIFKKDEPCIIEDKQK